MSKPAAQAAAAAAARAHAISHSGPGGSPGASAATTPIAPSTEKPEKKRGLLRKSRTTWLTKTSEDPVPFPAPETSTSKEKTDLSSVVENQEENKPAEQGQTNEESKTTTPPEIVTEVKVPDSKEKPDTPNARPSSNMEVFLYHHTLKTTTKNKITTV